MLGVAVVLDGVTGLDEVELPEDESDEVLADVVDGAPASDDDFEARESVR